MVRADLVALTRYHSPQVEVEVRLNTNEAAEPPPAGFTADLSAAAREWAGLDPRSTAPRRLRSTPLPPAGPDLQILATAKQRERVVKRRAGASLVDLENGVLAVEFHSKLNTIGGDTVQMLIGGVAEAAERFDGLVVGNDAPNFCAGANLMMVLLAGDYKSDQLHLPTILLRRR